MKIRVAKTAWELMVKRCEEDEIVWKQSSDLLRWVIEGKISPRPVCEEEVISIIPQCQPNHMDDVRLQLTEKTAEDLKKNVKVNWTLSHILKDESNIDVSSLSHSAVVGLLCLDILRVKCKKICCEKMESLCLETIRMADERLEDELKELRDENEEMREQVNQLMAQYNALSLDDLSREEMREEVVDLYGQLNDTEEMIQGKAKRKIKKFSKLVVKSKTYKKRIVELEKFAKEELNASLGDMMEGVLKKEKKSVLELPEVKKAMDKRMEAWVKERKLTTKETWDLVVQTDLSDTQLTKLRFGLNNARDGLCGLLASPRSVGTLRRAEYKAIGERLETKHIVGGDGVFLSPEKSLKWIVELYGEDFDEEKTYSWKVSIDGKLFGNDDIKMVMVGLTPLGFEGVAVQSCYAVFPVALVCGTEKSVDLEMKLGELWKLMKELMERGEVIMPNGKIHKYDFIVVTDLAACWNLYVFGGFNSPYNCPYCMVFDAFDRGDMNQIWETWSRHDNLWCLFGISIEKFCICTLHLLLRVIDFFVQWLYVYVKDTDAQLKMATILSDDLRVGFKLYDSLIVSGKRVKTYNGKQCYKILKNIEKLAELIERPEAKATWGSFRDLFIEINEGKLGDNFKERAMQWGINMVDIHGDNNIRIYPHILILHGEALVKKFGPLKFLNQQGFENANCLNNYDGKRHTNHIIEFGTKRKYQKTEKVIFVQSDSISQVVYRSWTYHLHNPPALTKKAPQIRIAHMKSHTMSLYYNVDLMTLDDSDDDYNDDGDDDDNSDNGDDDNGDDDGGDGDDDGDDDDDE